MGKGCTSLSYFFLFLYFSAHLCYFILLYSVMRQAFLSCSAPFSIYFSQGDENVTYTCTHMYMTLIKLMISSLYNPTQALCHSRELLAIFTLKGVYFYPIFMGNQSLNICLDKNWNFRLVNVNLSFALNVWVKGDLDKIHFIQLFKVSDNELEND